MMKFNSVDNFLYPQFIIFFIISSLENELKFWQN